MADVCITEFTDPGCPFAYSAEPVRARLRWLYGAHIDFNARMVVLSESPQDYLDKGFTPDKQAALVVCSRVSDRDSARLVLDALGLLEEPTVDATPAVR